MLLRASDSAAAATESSLLTGPGRTQTGRLSDTFAASQTEANLLFLYKKT